MCIVISQIDLIRKYFENNRQGEYNTINLADTLELKESTVRRNLGRLAKQGIIIRSFRGFYRYNDIARSPDLKQLSQEYIEQFHGMKLISTRVICPKTKGCPTFGTNVLSQDKVSHFRYKLFGNQSNLEDYFGQITKDEMIRLTWRKARITIQLSKPTIEIDIRNSDQPFTIPELDCCLAFLECLFYPHFNEYDWRVVWFGIGIDVPFSILRIDGATSITLQHFQGWIKRWYEKKNLQIVRKELHGSINAPIDEFIKDLRGISPIGSGEIISTNKDIRIALEQLNNQYKEVKVKLDKLTEILPFLSKDPIAFTW